MTEVPDRNDSRPLSDSPVRQQAIALFGQTSEITDLKHQILVSLVGEAAILADLDKTEI